MSKRPHFRTPRLTDLRPWYDAITEPVTRVFGSIKEARNCRANLYAARTYDRDTYAAINSSYEDYPLTHLTIVLEQIGGAFHVTIQPSPLALIEPSILTPKQEWERCKDRVQRRELAELKRRNRHIPTIDELFPKGSLEIEQVTPAPPFKPSLPLAPPEPAPPPKVLSESYIITTAAFLERLQTYARLTHTFSREQVLQIALGQAAKKLNGTLAGEAYTLSPELESELDKAVKKVTEGS